MISIPLYLDNPHKCSYLDDLSAQFAYIHPDFSLNTDFYSQLISQGFRRSGDHAYKPYCTTCKKCIPARLAVQDFHPSRQQRRTLKKNADIEINIKPAKFEQAHYDLYQRYQLSRHTDGGMTNTTEENYINFLSSDWCNTLFIEFSCNNELAGVAVVDLLDNALSAVYTFFDPRFSARSLGVYAVLWQIDHAKSLGLEWLYLGYWIENCQKMSYKINYQPLQGLVDNQWRAIP
ncbi:leucyl-tRNA---protein transferase [Bathymodiolus platifrons methanotrophic gill symbiont]|uniref:arginyltransferase n=1 Tax=Bathymodiolus platifrons methanotrophic gill symbiont TaxID=113268 RepID=UPI0011CB5621|nr:arginyltransferase [Bathymodiolus platifrons methanotrophic gill symbiont]MCK5870643.1 arginyltransferase [Methyloprofundus sp.]TXK94268.1 arginyltransferase [Methylococcaceae bacterium CS5]TXL05307.1 arginyltransferase [Methylococcaceae bacterium CS1]TXL07980.1 arginyltransferase [Methylococcaceae bacterium CS3]TXL11790.1 arginyltransferase [Methylococcaceae bacterium CS2]TXL14991.1 arginyltransferase [Methylococcaceae bacterium HT4]TXL20360.1 arginyltransferase [Methylococcaceae bacteri